MPSPIVLKKGAPRFDSCDGIEPIGAAAKTRKIPKLPGEYTSRDFFSDAELLRVRKVMLALGWTWHDCGTPTVERMRRGLDDLLRAFARPGVRRTGSGGFLVEREHGCTRITFEAVTSGWKRPHAARR